MKLLIVIDSLGAGGAEKSTEIFCNFLQEKQVDFKILILYEAKTGIHKTMRSLGFQIEIIPKGPFLFQSKFIADKINSENFEVVHSILFASNIRTRFAKLFVDFMHVESLVSTVYSKERFSDKQINKIGLKVYKQIDSLTGRRWVDKFHSISNSVKEHYVQELKFDPSLIEVIPRGRKKIGIGPKNRKDEKVRILNVGRQVYAKGRIFLLEAINILRKKREDFSLVIIGRRGPATKDLVQNINKYQLDDIVKIVDYREDITDYYLNADLFIFPSLFEGLGGAAIEAQSAGLPIICNNIPVLHEVVKDRENGLFFDTKNPISIVQAIEFFLNDRLKIHEFGKAGLMNFDENFKEEVINKRLYEYLLSRSSK